MKILHSKFFLVAFMTMILAIIGCGNCQEERLEEERTVYEDRINGIITAIDEEFDELRNELDEATDEEREEI